jgi:hypothetical protein
MFVSSPDVWCGNNSSLIRCDFQSGCVSCFRAVLVHTTLSFFDVNSGFICLLNWCEFGQTFYLYSHVLLMEVTVSTSDEDGGFICLVKLSDVRPRCVHVLTGWCIVKVAIIS